MPPKRKRSRLFLTLDRKGKKKRSGEGNIAHTTDEAEPVDGGDESLELPPPLFHSTPSKGENATRREANQENTSLGSSDITCKWCNTSIKLPEVNEVDNIYGILCFSCGNINRLPNTMGGNGSTCNHSVLVAYELCHRCGSYGENKSDSGINRSHTHSHIGDGQVCDKCGFGLTKIHDTKSNNELNVPDDTLHNRDTDIVGKDVQVETSPSVESEGDLTFKKNTDIFAGPDTVSSRKDEVVDSDKETEDGNNITEVIEKIMPEYTKVLQTCETGDILKELLISLSNGQLQADSLTYAIFIDTLKALNATSLTEMRYSFLSKLFWKTFLNKFGAAPLRFLSGWKHAGSLLLGKSDRGSFAGAEANIIFSIPNEGVLKMFDPYEGEWPNVIAPGICHQVVDKIAAANKDTSICIAFDGKKVSPGLRGDKGDINLLGRENEVDGLTPAEQKAVHVTELQDVNSIKQLICSERNAKSLDQMKSILDKLRKLLTHLTVKKALTRETLGKKTYALEKLKSRAAQDSSATSSKYQYPISLVTANIIELKELDATGDRLREELAEICVKMIKGQGSLPNLSVVNISEYWRYHSLQDIDLLSRSEVPLLEQFSKEIINMGLRFVKQRSTFWFKARSEVKVTASTLYNALGCAGLKAQKEHYQQTVLGFDRPATPSNVQEAMDWGTKHEICALSTIVSKVILYFTLNVAY
ncbi:uncharacterized protein [Ptychodera flava]|uniref:uncharacterized protein n=1 Tax=Ptychodera flava TaxID=63121 RepID=UPI00396A6310